MLGLGSLGGLLCSSFPSMDARLVSLLFIGLVWRSILSSSSLDLLGLDGQTSGFSSSVLAPFSFTGSPPFSFSIGFRFHSIGRSSSMSTLGLVKAQSLMIRTFAYCCITPAFPFSSVHVMCTGWIIISRPPLPSGMVAASLKLSWRSWRWSIGKSFKALWMSCSNSPRLFALACSWRNGCPLLFYRQVYRYPFLEGSLTHRSFRVHTT